MDTVKARAGRDWAMLALVVLIGLNLRPFLAAPAPILAEIVADTGLGYGGIAMLTLLPMFLMGLGAFIAPGLQVKLGARRGLLIALGILLLGSAPMRWPCCTIGPAVLPPAGRCISVACW